MELKQKTKLSACYVCRDLNITKRSLKLFIIQLAEICFILYVKNETYKNLMPHIY